MDNSKFVEAEIKKQTIKKLEEEINEIETKLRKTFADDVLNFFISKGYTVNKGRYEPLRFHFDNLRQIDEKNTFEQYSTPEYYIAGKNKLVVRFEWHLKKNISLSQIYWYPAKQTLDDFYNRRLKKVLILPITVERKNKLEKLEKL